MAGFGDNLRRERELRGVTLPELARATRISQKHLRSLEASAFEDLPGGIINRGFVRTIARYLKLDEEFWVSEFMRAAGEDPESALRPPGLLRTPLSRGSAIALTALIIVFGVTAFSIHRLQQQAAGEPSTPVAAADTAPSASGPQSAGGETSSGPTITTTRAGEELVEVPAGEPLRVQVDALEEVWIRITVDGEVAQERVWRAQESMSFEGRDSIEVGTRNASAVILTLNGETLPPLGFPGESKTLLLRRPQPARAQ